MRTFLALVLMIVLTSNVSGQFDFKLQKIDFDSVIEINGVSIHKYISRTIRYPIAAQQNSIVGTFIGRIRIDSAGNLLLVSVVNSLGKSIDNEFESVVKSAWKKQNVKVKNLSDTIDFIIPIKFMLTTELAIPPLGFHVDIEQAPKNMYKQIVVMGFNSNGTASITDDMILINNANKNFKAGKYKKCIKYLDELIRRNPYNADIVFMRAKSYLAMADKEKGCIDFCYLKSFLNNNRYKEISECQ